MAIRHKGVTEHLPGIHISCATIMNTLYKVALPGMLRVATKAPGPDIRTDYQATEIRCPAENGCF